MTGASICRSCASFEICGEKLFWAFSFLRRSSRFSSKRCAASLSQSAKRATTDLRLLRLAAPCGAGAGGEGGGAAGGTAWFRHAPGMCCSASAEATRTAPQPTGAQGLLASALGAARPRRRARCASPRGSGAAPMPIEVDRARARRWRSSATAAGDLLPPPPLALQCRGGRADQPPLGLGSSGRSALIDGQLRDSTIGGGWRGAEQPAPGRALSERF
eukprot:SAG31_NODE_10119_length_1180_cov_1.743756_1_plen_217_part_00